MRPPNRNARLGPGRAALALAVMATLGATGCGRGGPAGSPVLVQSRTQWVGPVLVDSAGHTLYLFAPDRHTAVTCVQSCQGNWPPLTLPVGATPQAGPGVRPDLLGSAANPDGGRVVTYHGWPLYTYAGDGGPGQLRGHARNLNGGVWYAVTATGQPA